MSEHGHHGEYPTGYPPPQPPADRRADEPADQPTEMAPPPFALPTQPMPGHDAPPAGDTEATQVASPQPTWFGGDQGGYGQPAQPAYAPPPAEPTLVEPMSGPVPDAGEATAQIGYTPTTRMPDATTTPPTVPTQPGPTQPGPEESTGQITNPYAPPAQGYQPPSTPAAYETPASSGYGYETPAQPSYGYETPAQPSYGYETPGASAYGSPSTGTPPGSPMTLPPDHGSSPYVPPQSGPPLQDSGPYGSPVSPPPTMQTTQTGTFGQPAPQGMPTQAVPQPQSPYATQALPFPAAAPAGAPPADVARPSGFKRALVPILASVSGLLLVASVVLTGLLINTNSELSDSRDTVSAQESEITGLEGDVSKLNEELAETRKQLQTAQQDSQGNADRAADLAEEKRIISNCLTLVLQFLDAVGANNTSQANSLAPRVDQACQQASTVIE